MHLSILLPGGNITTIELPVGEGIDSNEIAIELIAAVHLSLLW